MDRSGGSGLLNRAGIVLLLSRFKAIALISGFKPTLKVTTAAHEINNRKIKPMTSSRPLTLMIVSVAVSVAVSIWAIVQLAT